MERCKEKIDENGYKKGRENRNEDCAPIGRFKVYCKRTDEKIQIDLNDWLKNKIVLTPTSTPTTSAPLTSAPATSAPLTSV